MITTTMMKYFHMNFMQVTSSLNSYLPDKNFTSKLTAQGYFPKQITNCDSSRSSDVKLVIHVKRSTNFNVATFWFFFFGPAKFIWQKGGGE